MELTTDVLLKGPIWAKTIDSLSPIFTQRTNYSIFMLCVSIGIMYDQRIESFEEGDEPPRNVPRNVMQNQEQVKPTGKLEFMFQAAILSTLTENMSEDDRLELAFGESTDFKKLEFLTQFANFGVTKLAELVGETVIESMENIKNFLTSTVEGSNFDIDGLSDDILLGLDLQEDF